VTEDRNPPSSPACLAHEADDAYMGFATKAEITELMAALRQADDSPPVDKAAVAARLRKILPRLRDDTLYRELSARLTALEGGA
jgi:hypothetical protein